MAGTKFLANKGGSRSSRNHSDNKKYVDHTEDKHIITDSNKKSRAKPMKTLLSQEMSNEIKLKRKQSNVVARLMGLDEPSPTNKLIMNDGKNFEDGYFYNPIQSEHDFNLRYEYERKMALVREKFAEVKGLTTNGNPLQSREFQDALDILNSNTELLHKFFEESKSLLNVHTRTHKITLLKPLKEVGSETKKKEHLVSKPARIVVLKPTMPKLSSSWSSFSSGISRDESFISSALSNGYVGDGSSFDMTDSHVKFDDSDITTPTSRHSFDNSNMYGSPGSFSSFSRASGSPDSSMIREAKKRLSERWSLVACDANNGDVIEERKSSSTLGEMLAVSELKKGVHTLGHNVSSSKAYDSLRNEEDTVIKCQLSSQPVKIASSSHENNVSKLRKEKSSLKEKFSSLLFYRNKKGAKNKASLSTETSNEKVESTSPATHKSISFRDVLSLEKMSELTSSESDKIAMNQNQTSPTSVLDALFENTHDSPRVPNARLPLPPLESLDASSLETLHLHVHDILATAGIYNERSDMIFSIWHSVDSPLGLNLLNKFLDPKEESAKGRERRSNQRLVFDSVNAALVEIGKSCIRTRQKPQIFRNIEDEVLLILKDWLSMENKSKACESNVCNVIVDTLLRKELGGSEWDRLAASEIDGIGEEISELAFDGLLAEALEDFIAQP